MKNPFIIAKIEDKTRLGAFQTAHGIIETPNFMPVGTQASVKSVDCERLKEIGAQVVLVNTYHLWLRPGHEIIRDLRGIHRFMGWHGPILSDSGGFQVFSLKDIRKLTEDGVEFRSHLDGSLKFLSPEIAIQVQEALGVDIAMVLDECPSGVSSFEEAEKSLALTLRWAKRSFESRRREDMAVFGITQGAMYRRLRTRAAECLSEIPFDGMAIGGLSVGEDKDVMYEILNDHVSELPGDKIRYLMGVGTPEDIVQAISEGVDLFDCVMPTRSGRFGRAFINEERPFINIRNACHALSDNPLDKNCSCISCRNYSRAYLHHLFKSSEMLGPQLLTIHNLTHYLDLMLNIRRSIQLGAFKALYDAQKRRWRNIGEEEINE